jgi:hypothetical protein
LIGDTFPVTVAGRLIAGGIMLVGLMAIAMPITVLGSNFQTEYDGNQASEKQRSKDIFTAITIGLTEYQHFLTQEYERTERQEERVLLKLVETELFKVGHASAELRDQDQARLELEQNAAGNAETLALLQSDIRDLKAGMGLLLRSQGIDPTLVNMFQQADADDNGLLDQKDKGCLDKLGQQTSNNQINAMMAQTDIDRDGQVSYEEFVPVCEELVPNDDSGVIVATVVSGVDSTSLPSGNQKREAAEIKSNVSRARILI